MRKSVIVSATRTPMGNFGGTLSRMGAPELGAVVIREAIKRAGIENEQVDECIMGMVLPCGYGQNPARIAAYQAGLSQDVGAMTINKVCGSSLKSVMLADQAIRCGDADVVVAGGMESMSMAPFYLPKARWGQRMGSGKIEDHMIHDGLWDVVNDFHMGMTNEIISEKWGISREDQDRYAAMSYERVNASIEKGLFKDEIVPVDVPTRKGIVVFDTDECSQKTDYEFLSKMKPAFKKDGVGTAGNASIISDGAAALVIMAEDKAKELGCNIMATIGSQAAAGIDMKYILMAPINAVPKVLKKEGVVLSEIDLIEVNEAFSGSSVGINKVLKLDPGKVNVNGGCIALGHPIGASGARILTTLVYEMQRRDAKRGMATLCLGGGEAVALIVNR